MIEEIRDCCKVKGQMSKALIGKIFEVLRTALWSIKNSELRMKNFGNGPHWGWHLVCASRLEIAAINRNLAADG